MKVAIVHDWLTTYAGAETIVDLWLQMYPGADIYTLVYDAKKMAGHFEGSKIYTSSLQKLPCATKIYTKLLKFMPKAFESFDLSGYDLVLCSSSSCAKGVIVPPYIPQIAYVHTPMRYAWDLFFDYKKRSSRLTRFFMNKWMPSIRLWDFVSAQRIDTIVANSKYIARRIKKFWNRDSVVINPPVNVSRFSDDPEITEREDFYVFFSRLVPYKRADLAIQACKELGRELVVIGGGSEYDNLKKMAQGCDNIKFTGRASDSDVKHYLQRCKAMIFCAEEDFGITPLEAQVCGAPVIAFGRGGARETVLENKTGVFFEKQEVNSVVSAIKDFEEKDSQGLFQKSTIIKHAKSFTEEKFKKEFAKVVEDTIEKVKVK